MTSLRPGGEVFRDLQIFLKTKRRYLLGMVMPFSYSKNHTLIAYYNNYYILHAYIGSMVFDKYRKLDFPETVYE